MANQTATSIDFGQIKNWIFDLDNTLYPAHSDLFSQVSERMTTYIRLKLSVSHETADRMRSDYYRRYGTTLHGLMTEHKINPHDFLDYVHDIDHSPLEPDPALGEAIAELPGRKFVLTNGSVGHAEGVLKALAVPNHFDDIFDIVAAEFRPKPAREPYQDFIGKNGIDPATSIMFEDIPVNLTVPKELGMATVLVVPRKDRRGAQISPEWREPHEDEGASDPHIDAITDNITTYLADVIEGFQQKTPA